MITNDAAYQASLAYQANLQLIITGGDTSALDPVMVGHGPVWAQTIYDSMKLRTDNYLAGNPNPNL